MLLAPFLGDMMRYRRRRRNPDFDQNTFVKLLQDNDADDAAAMIVTAVGPEVDSKNFNLKTVIAVTADAVEYVGTNVKARPGNRAQQVISWAELQTHAQTTYREAFEAIGRNDSIWQIANRIKVKGAVKGAVKSGDQVTVFQPKEARYALKDEYQSFLRAVIGTGNASEMLKFFVGFRMSKGPGWTTLSKLEKNGVVSAVKSKPLSLLAGVSVATIYETAWKARILLWELLVKEMPSLKSAVAPEIEVLQKKLGLQSARPAYTRPPKLTPRVRRKKGTALPKPAEAKKAVDTATPVIAEATGDDPEVVKLRLLLKINSDPNFLARLTELCNVLRR